MPKKSKAKKKVAQARAKAKAPAAKQGKKKLSAARSKPRAKKVQAIPPQYGSVTAHLVVSPCNEALDFYTKAFGGKVTSKMPGPDGAIMHAEMKIGDSIVMFADEMPPMPGGGAVHKTPKNAGATTATMMLYVKNADAAFDRAVAAGATPAMPLQDMFWGDRYGQVQDPFGHVWAIATHQRDVSAKEMRKAMAQMGPPAA